MSEEKAEYNVGGETIEKPEIDIKDLGKCWAAIKNEQVIGTISMLVPSYVDFDEYRNKANDCLSMLGVVKSGQLIEREGVRYFIQRLTHANRSKKPRTPKTYIVDGTIK